MSKLRHMLLDRLPKGSELNIRILAASTGAFRLRLTVARPVPGGGQHAEMVHALKLAVAAAATPHQATLLAAAAEKLGGFPVEVEQEDVAMTLADLLLDLHRFAGENMAVLTARKLDAGAGKKL